MNAVDIEKKFIVDALESWEYVFQDVVCCEKEEREQFEKDYGIPADVGLLVLRGIIKEWKLGHNGSQNGARLIEKVLERVGVRAAEIAARAMADTGTVEHVSVEDTLTETRQRRVVAGRPVPPLQRQQIARGTAEPVDYSDIPDRPLTHADCVAFIEAIRGTRKLIQYKLSEQLQIPYNHILDITGKLRHNLPLWHRMCQGPYLDDDEAESVCRFLLFHEPVQLKRLEWEPDEAAGPTAEPDRAGLVKCNQCSERFSPKDALQHKRSKHPVTENPRGSDERSLIGNSLK